MPINRVQKLFNPRILVNKNDFRPYVRKHLKNMDSIASWADKKDVYIKVLPDEKSEANLVFEIVKKGYEHVCDAIPTAIKNNTGDTVYIPVEKTLKKLHIPFLKEEEMLKVIKAYTK